MNDPMSVPGDSTTPPISDAAHHSTGNRIQFVRDPTVWLGGDEAEARITPVKPESKPLAT